VDEKNYKLETRIVWYLVVCGGDTDHDDTQWQNVVSEGCGCGLVPNNQARSIERYKKLPLNEAGCTKSSHWLVFVDTYPTDLSSVIRMFRSSTRAHLVPEDIHKYYLQYRRNRECFSTLFQCY